jgi:hypothetical protein
MCPLATGREDVPEPREKDSFGEGGVKFVGRESVSWLKKNIKLTLLFVVLLLCLFLLLFYIRNWPLLVEFSMLINKELNYYYYFDW